MRLAATLALSALGVFGQAGPKTFSYTGTEQDLTLLGTALRMIGDIRDLAPDPAQGTLKVSGNDVQMSLIAWLFDQIDRPAARPVQHATSAEYVMPDEREGVVRLLSFAQATSEQEFQDAGTALRGGGAGPRRLFPLNWINVHAVRGSREEIDLALWLFDQIDRPIGEPRATQEYLLPQTTEVVRVLYRPGITLDGMKELMGRVNTQAGVRAVFAYVPTGAIGLLGPVAQVLRAEQLLQ